MASVNHLEIPAELAFVLSKLDNWEPVNTEKSLAKVSGQVTIQLSRGEICVANFKPPWEWGESGSPSPSTPSNWSVSQLAPRGAYIIIGVKVCH